LALKSLTGDSSTGYDDAMASPFAEKPPRNRLTIAHLMLWTLGTAIALALYRAYTPLGEASADNRTQAIWQSLAFGYCLPAGARIGGLLLFGVHYLRRNQAFPSQPGHWLLVIEGLSAVLSWAGRAVAIFAQNGQQGGLDGWAAAQIVNCLVTTIAYGAVAIRDSRVESMPWNGVLWLLTVEHAAALLTVTAILLQGLGAGTSSFRSPPAFLAIYSVQATCCPALLVVLLPLAGIFDPVRRQRDFLHWTGIGCMVVSGLLNLAVPFLSQLLR